MLLEAGAGALLGLFLWIGYKELSDIDPFEARRFSGLPFALLTGAIVYRTRARPVLWAIAGAIAFMILLVSFTPIVRKPVHSLIRADSATAVDAVIVLSAGVTDDGLLGGQGTDRLLSGIEFLRTGLTRNIVITLIQNDGVYSTEDQTRLLGMAPAGTKVFSTAEAWSTRDEAVFTAKIAAAQHWSRIAVITSPTHTRRACATFEKLALQVVCIPAAARDMAVYSLRGSWDRLQGFRLWLYESLATSEYARRGWI